MSKKKSKIPPLVAVQEAGATPLGPDLLMNLVGYNCRRAWLCIMPLYTEGMAQYDLRTADLAVLSLLCANPGITQRRLSHAVGIAPPNLAVLLDRLEARGLLRRQRNPLDKRSQTLSLTGAGTRLYTKAEKTVCRLDLDATAMLTAEEREQLLGLLQKIVPAGESRDQNAPT